MSRVMSEFKEKFKTEELLIFETEYWIWSLRPVQATLGAGILSLKRECKTFSELIQDEFSDLGNIITVIEKTLKKSFNYDIMNYLMLMMIDKQVHYHIIPRYKNGIDFARQDWIDFGWPGVPNLTGEEIEHDVLEGILITIKANLIV
jgi:diadenosine tetraphosphate (Ap4A) HIT family hydrolase